MLTLKTPVHFEEYFLHMALQTYTMQDIPLTIDFKGRHMKGIAVPLGRSALDQPPSFDIIIDKAFMGTLRWNAQGWKMDAHHDPQLVDKIGKYILDWYVRPIE